MCDNSFTLTLSLPLSLPPSLTQCRIRIFCAALFSALSFILVGLSLSIPVVIFGVICASIASGLGEITFLSFTTHYDKSTVSSWASGTGRSCHIPIPDTGME